VSLFAEQLADWERDGFCLLRGFGSRDVVDAMLARVVETVRAKASGADIAPAYLVAESATMASAKTPEQAVSKLFRIHREDAVFREFCSNDRVLDVVESLLGSELDCFLSQFIFKHPGALGQPWHQDAFYFPFDRSPQVGLWLAVTEATLDNGPLWVVPGSHRDPVHDVVPDQREHANISYVEIVSRDTSDARPVLMQPGDLLVFHSHLMHKSTDNQSDAMRAAMVYHYGETGTIDQSRERFGFVPPNIDWMSVRGHAV
jgi:phytanoyl-CoA hydroxylase